MATKTCRAAKLYQRPLNSMRSLSALKETSESGDKRLVPKKVQIYIIYRHHDRSHNPLLRRRARGKKATICILSAHFTVRLRWFYMQQLKLKVIHN